MVVILYMWSMVSDLAVGRGQVTRRQHSLLWQRWQRHRTWALMHTNHQSPQHAMQSWQRHDGLTMRWIRLAHHSMALQGGASRSIKVFLEEIVTGLSMFKLSSKSVSLHLQQTELQICVTDLLESLNMLKPVAISSKTP